MKHHQLASTFYTIRGKHHPSSGLHISKITKTKRLIKLKSDTLKAMCFRTQKLTIHLTSHQITKKNHNHDHRSTFYKQH
uniref:Uncharacterized protein n=1 Tax=Rhizophora mucronata TaxID=61149 RepID=A0A2P2MIG7_RHIMU